jgi:hypothetical protein
MVAGDRQNWTIMSDGSHAIGPLQGMVEGTSLAFDPGWAGVGKPVDEYTDIRTLSEDLRSTGLEPIDDTMDDSPSGPASFTLTDPDGNAILIDQHV